MTGRQSRRLCMCRLVGFLLGDLGLLLDLADVDVGNVGLVAVDDTGELLEGGSLGLDVHEVDEAEFEEDPALLAKELVFVVFVHFEESRGKHTV